MLKQALEEAILHHSFGTAQTGQHQLRLISVSFPCSPVVNALPLPRLHLSTSSTSQSTFQTICVFYSTIFSSQNHRTAPEVQPPRLQQLFLIIIFKAPTPGTSQTAPSADTGFREQPSTLPSQSCPALHMARGFTWKRDLSHRSPGFSLADSWLSETETPQAPQLLHTHSQHPKPCIFPPHHPLTTPKVWKSSSLGPSWCWWVELAWFLSSA